LNKNIFGMASNHPDIFIFCITPCFITVKQCTIKDLFLFYTHHFFCQYLTAIINQYWRNKMFHTIILLLWEILFNTYLNLLNLAKSIRHDLMTLSINLILFIFYMCRWIVIRKQDKGLYVIHIVSRCLWKYFIFMHNAVSKQKRSRVNKEKRDKSFRNRYAMK